MPEFWEARITRITVSDDQSQMHETTFQQRIEIEPDLQPLIDAYGPSLHAPVTLASMMPPRVQGG